MPVDSRAQYDAEGGIVTRGPLKHYGNRPLYGNNSNSLVIAGDRPLIRYARGQCVYGTFIAALLRGDEPGKWLHLSHDITSMYRDGCVDWAVRDSSLPGTIVKLGTAPLCRSSGVAIRLQVEGAQATDRLIWAYGGMRRTRDASWDLDVLAHPELLLRGFDPKDSTDNIAQVVGDGFSVALSQQSSRGRCSVPTRLVIADAARWDDPAMLAVSPAEGLPLVCGAVSAEHLEDVRWAIWSDDPAPAPTQEALTAVDPAHAFETAVQHKARIAKQVAVSTPDAHLNALAEAAAVAIDGSWYPPVFVHGGMSWNLPFPGWRTLFGATAYGWHDRVKAEAKFYIDSQVRESHKVTAQSDPTVLLTAQHRDSRFYGKGRIERDQAFYNMQSQFFDQLVHSWRWTADPELEAILRPALELHLEWLRECFDPDDDGVYESYIDTWPTDSVWYNGGGSVEATVYAYRGHAGARDLAARASDVRAVELHSARLEKIRKGFFEKLWIPHKGHPGAYREQGGHQRLHEAAWLYSVFLAVDSGGLLSSDQAAQALRYTETALQNDPAPLGGRTVYASNWVPGVWSARENTPGDNYHLALAYFQTGLAEDAWDVFRGSFLQMGYGCAVPGNLGAPWGTDFGDCLHMFGRTLVEGLFGYSPNYPMDVVSLSPQFPASWDRASIATPDVAVRFDRSGGTTTLDIRLTHAAQLVVRLPIRAEHITAVTVDGALVDAKLVPGFGHTVAEVKLSRREAAVVAVSARDLLPQFAAAPTAVEVGEMVELEAEGARILSVADPQSATAGAVVRDGRIQDAVAVRPGHHTLIAEVGVGDLRQLRLFQLEVKDPAGAQRRRAALVEEIPDPVGWETVDLTSAFNGDVRQIFRQKYLSPRPATVSLRLGSDGYSAWTFPHWRSGPPSISLNDVSGMFDSSSGCLVTAQGVPFHWSTEGASANNIAFTSLWDNWPDQVAFAVNGCAEAAFFLIAGSTNMMQCGIANAELRLEYADGGADRLELVPPLNYWSLAPIRARVPGQRSRSDYTDPIDAFAVPMPHPQTVRLGTNCRAMLLNRRLRRDAELRSVTLEALSQEIVVGLMGLTLMNPRT